MLRKIFYCLYVGISFSPKKLEPIINESKIDKKKFYESMSCIAAIIFAMLTQTVYKILENNYLLPNTINTSKLIVKMFNIFCCALIAYIPSSLLTSFIFFFSTSNLYSTKAKRTKLIYFHIIVVNLLLWTIVFLLGIKYNSQIIDYAQSFIPITIFVPIFFTRARTFIS